VSKLASDFTTSATAWLNAGGAHQSVRPAAIGPVAFEDFARMAGTGFLPH
jgi:L-arabinose isomerase